KTPEMVRKEVWIHLLAYNLLRTVMAVAAAESRVEPRKISFKGAQQAVTAFAPKLEAARPAQRAGLVEAMLKAVAYHRVGDRPGRWEPRARKRRPKPGKRLTQPRRVAKLAHNRAKWYERLAPWAAVGRLPLGQPGKPGRNRGGRGSRAPCGQIPRRREAAAAESAPQRGAPGPKGGDAVQHARRRALHGRRQRAFGALSSSQNRPRHRLSLRHSSKGPTRTRLRRNAALAARRSPFRS